MLLMIYGYDWRRDVNKTYNHTIHVLPSDLLGGCKWAFQGLRLRSTWAFIWGIKRSLGRSWIVICNPKSESHCKLQVHSLQLPTKDPLTIPHPGPSLSFSYSYSYSALFVFLVNGGLRVWVIGGCTVSQLWNMRLWFWYDIWFDDNDLYSIYMIHDYKYYILYLIDSDV